jgi:CRISPR-associated RAMP protein (TIGR02581 family)
MLKQLLNECVIDLTIEPDGPILIKSGQDTIRGPNMAFVKTWRDGEEQVYLPGSSLKGVLRSHAERIARTLQPDSACDPFVDPKLARSEPERATMLFCGHRFRGREDRKETLSNATIYSHSCPICRLFGSTYYGGRLATTDAYAVGGAPRPERRDGVGIDRFTGGAARGAKFDLEVVTHGEFATSLHLRNFELWQLGLVGFLLEDFKDGLIRVGMAKSRGLGKVKAQVSKVRIDFLGLQAPKPAQGKLALKGIGALNESAKAYGAVQPDVVEVDFAGAPQPGSSVVRTIYHFDEADRLWAQVGQAWVTYITETYRVPEAMQHQKFV